jgi:hypothetical protein
MEPYDQVDMYRQPRRAARRPGFTVGGAGYVMCFLGRFAIVIRNNYFRTLMFGAGLYCIVDT